MDFKNKKIAIITPLLANGGLEKVAVTGAEELRKTYDVTLIVMDSYQIDYPYSGKMIDLKVSLVGRGIFKRMYNMAASAWKLRKLKKKYGFDLVISHGELASIPNIFSGGKRNILVVHENRFAALKDIQGKFVNKAIKYLYSLKSVSKVVTVSEGTRESFIEILGLDNERVLTVHNPYEIDEIKKLAMEDMGAMGALYVHPVLTSVGRLTTAKGQWYLLRIFNVLKKTDPTFKLVILGDGELKEELVKVSEDLGLKTYAVWSEEQFDDNFDVYFLGFQKNPFKFIKQAKLFAMTSLWEGFGGTIVEAMACGTPVISSNCKSGPGEIIASKLIEYTIQDEAKYEGSGVLMPVFENKFVGADTPLDKNEQFWVNSLQELLKDDEKLAYYREKGFQRAEDFRLEVIMAEWKHLIDTCFLEEK